MNIQFATGIAEGLTSCPKYINDKYFYDKKGGEIFEKIMKSRRYYPTKCETEIFNANKNEWSQIFTGNTDKFNLIEFGVGNGCKTHILLKNNSQQHVKFDYFPVDISADVLNRFKQNLSKEFPEISVNPVNDDYFNSLSRLSVNNSCKKVVLFIGNNLGNFKTEESEVFLRRISGIISPGDILFLGLDLIKDPKIIFKAYRKTFEPFCIRIFDVINRESGSNFKSSDFRYFVDYNAKSGNTYFYLISKIKQSIYIKTLDVEISFGEWEPVYVGNSRKYSITDIETLADTTGFNIIKNYYDSKKYFVNTIWKLK